MTEKTTPAADAPRSARTASYGYTLICGLSLFLLIAVEFQLRQAPMLLVLMMTLGTIGLLTGMRMAPLLMVLFVTFCHIARQHGIVGHFNVERGPALSATNILLCAAVLGFVASHYRLQGLNRFVLPPNHGKRSPALVTTMEWIGLAVSLPLWALAAQYAWYWLAQPRDVLEWPQWVARLTVFMLLLVPGLTVAAMLLRQFRRRRMKLDEATLLLQDTLWNETRGEQRWVTRWLSRLSVGRKGG